MQSQVSAIIGQIQNQFTNLAAGENGSAVSLTCARQAGEDLIEAG